MAAQKGAHPKVEVAQPVRVLDTFMASRTDRAPTTAVMFIMQPHPGQSASQPDADLDDDQASQSEAVHKVVDAD